MQSLRSHLDYFLSLCQLNPALSLCNSVTQEIINALTKQTGRFDEIDGDGS